MFVILLSAKKTENKKSNSHALSEGVPSAFACLHNEWSSGHSKGFHSRSWFMFSGPKNARTQQKVTVLYIVVLTAPTGPGMHTANTLQESSKRWRNRENKTRLNISFSCILMDLPVWYACGWVYYSLASHLMRLIKAWPILLTLV